MRILRVHISNLNSLRQQITIDFEASPLAHAGIFAITGPTGAGKTTILDAITLALYGQIARSGKDVKEVISYGATQCHAEVEFSVQDKKYMAGWRMHRARNKPDGKLVGPKRELARWDEKALAFLPVAEKIKAVDEAIESITKLDYQRFSRSVLLSQGDFAAFLKSGERERSDLLERITGTGIYSELSIAAFNRYRLEQQKLTQLRERQEQLGLLTDEEIDEASIEAQRQTVRQHAKLAGQNQVRVQQLDRWLETRQRIETLQREASSLEMEQNAFLPESIRLKKSLALRPFQAELEQIRLVEQQVEELNQEIETINIQLGELKTQQTAVDARHKEAEAAFKTLKADASKKETLFRKVDRLDQQLATETQEQERLVKEKNAHQEEHTKLQQQLAKIQQDLSKHEQELEELNTWLSGNKNFEQLVTQLPLIEQQREQLLDIYQLQTQLNKEKSELLAQKESNEQTLKTIATTYKAAQKQQKIYESDFQEKLPADFKLDQQLATQRLSSAIVELQDRRQLIRELRDLDQEYQRLLKEQQSYESRLEELMMAQQNTNKALLNISDLRITFAEELKYKREIYQQQQLIANYEKDRQELKAGDPCPLCLSENHPFHEHPVTPFVDKAKGEFEKADAYAEKLQAQERQLLQQETALHQEIESLHGNDLKPVNGRLHTQREKLLHYEERIALLLHAPSEEWSNSRGELLQQQLTQLEEKLNKWRNAQSALESLENQINITTEQLQGLDRKELTLKGKQQGVEAQLERFIKEEEELKLKFNQAKSKLDNIIQPMGYEFELSSAKETFAELRKLSETFSTKQERSQDIHQRLALLQTELTALDKQLIKQTQILEKAKSLQAKQEEKKHQILKERQELLGEQTVASAREALEDTIREKEQTLQKVLEQATVVRDKLARIQQSHQDKQEEQQKRATAIGLLIKKMLPALKKLNYQDIAAARQDQLGTEEEDQLQQKAQHLQKRQAETQRALKESRQDELKYQPEKTDQDTQEKIRTEWQAARDQQDQALLQLGQLEQRYQQQQERQKQHQTIMKDINAQMTVFNRWAQLNEIIGQADGKKFRTYAQGLTLQRLVTLANQHLEKLNGRYYISKQKGSDLELEIIDTFQADNRRSMFTLSGGESFLISLALALGLSDLAGRHAQIQSLFIDEGFGTLDEHSLDLALDTLENLQSGGKTIGVISHVKALKERISVQIQVHKKSNGFSYLSLV